MAPPDPPHREMFPALRRSSAAAWQVGAIRLPVWMPAPDRPQRAWIAMCLDLQAGKVLSSDLGRREDLDRMLAELFSRAGGDWQARPSRVEVEAADAELVANLEALLTPQGVKVETALELPELREIQEGLLAEMDREDPRPSPLTGDGVTLDRLAAFAREAASFYASACWHHLTGEDTIHVESPAVDDALRYFILSRQGGRTLSALYFFPNPGDFAALADGEMDVEDLPIARDGLWAINFEPPWGAPASDLELWERYELPWAGANNLCPVASFLGPHVRERPDRRQLAFLQGLLAALAATREEDLDRGRWHQRVTTADGPMDFTLALPALLAPEDEAPTNDLFVAPRAAERSLRDIGKLLQGREFSSEEEINEFLAGALADGRLTQKAPETPEEQAQELVDRASGARGRRGVLLAKQALELWPDCADAYNLLAERTIAPESALQLYTRAMAAGERSLDPQLFRDDGGNFWGIVETRPYMRARFGVAQTLSEQDRFAEAAAHFAEILRLNPDDSQGARHSLVNLLLALDRDAEAEALLARFSADDSALLAFPLALLTFRREGDSPEARRDLKRALRANRFVPGLLTGPQEMLAPPAAYSWGSEEEASMVCLLSLDTWVNTPGALDWLRRRAELPAQSKVARGRAKKRRKKRR